MAHSWSGLTAAAACRYGHRVRQQRVFDEKREDDRGRLLVADTMNHRVLALDLQSLEVTILAGTGERGYAGDGGPATSALLDTPVGVEVSSSGAVVVADLGNDVLRVIDAGMLRTVAGGISGDSVEVEMPEAFPLRGPAGLAWTPEGDLLVAERSGHRALRWMGAADAR